MNHETPPPGIASDNPPPPPITEVLGPAPQTAHELTTAQAAAIPITWQAFVFLAWLVGVSILFILLAQRFLFVKSLFAQSRPADGELADTLNQCRKKVGIKRDVELKLTSNMLSPAACGLFKPAILMPDSLLDNLSQAKLRAVLIHELAHIKRGDLWVNFIQTLLQIVYFYNPLLWPANATVRRVREKAVDEMVLTKLGDEAKDYSNTLIDIAEIAFSKPHFSLRLVGVVESKKALTGRIKHILNRPMPKTAKLGIFGLLAIIIAAVVLLPMARAKREIRDYVRPDEFRATLPGGVTVEQPATIRVPEDYPTLQEAVEAAEAGDTLVVGAGLYAGEEGSIRPKYSATLPEGTTVELLGICSYDGASKQWWRPDGAPFDPGLKVQEYEEYRGRDRLGFAVKLNTTDFRLAYKIEGVGSHSGMDVYDADGTKLRNHRTAVGKLSDERDSTTVRIGVAAGEWETVAEYDGGVMTFVGPNDVVFSEPIETARGTTIALRGEWGYEGTRRIMAIDKAGKIHDGGWRGRSTGLKTLATVEFRDVKPAQIAKYQLQFRPYQWATFKNVSLRAGHKTDVEAEGGTTNEADEVRYEGRTIAEWMSQWDSKLYEDTRAATAALIKIGRPAVPRLIEEIKKRSNYGWHAVGVLSKMGPEAEDAVPWLIKVALDKDVRIGKGWESKASYRENVVSCLNSMTWARDQVIPVLKRIAQDNEDDTRLRRVAILFLRDVGKEGIPILRKVTKTEDEEIQTAAHHMLAQSLLKEQGLSKEDYYTPLIEKDLFGARVPEYLAVMKSPGPVGHPHPLTQKIKRLYRQRLEEKYNAQLAGRLAAIIQYGLRNTELTWAAPADGSIRRWPREDPTENYTTLAEVLQLRFDLAESGSQLWRQFGIILAKLHLLQGDWDGMNAKLKELGKEPIPKQSRRWLSAPPVDWREDLSSRWVAADESMRSGNCSLEFEVEKDGKGLKGAHFLVKRADPRGASRQSGINIDTLFYQPYPYSFGYKAKDRPMTRYAVSDESGIVRFEKLPKIPIKIEVLVPTSNFPEAVSNWDLWMEVEPGKFKIAKKYGAGAINTQVPPAVAELKEGQTVHYPKLVVRSAFGLNVRDWDQVDKENFRLTWQGLDPSIQAQDIEYELQMHLSSPASPHNQATNAPVVRSAKQLTKNNQWPISAQGVGNLHLEPGNIYIFEVRAIDESGTVVARWPRTRVWVPWGYRRSDPPFTGHDTYANSPVHHGLWHRGSFGYGDGRKETLREKVARVQRDYPDAFEYEYACVGKAWLDWRDGESNGARRQLEKLAKELPTGSIVRGTAVWLIEQIDQDEEPTKRLNFVPDAESSSSKTISLPDEKTDVEVEGEPLKKSSESDELASVKIPEASAETANQDISGFVTDENGVAIVGAVASIMNKDLVLSAKPIKFGEREHFVLSAQAHGVTGSDGRFKVASLKPGRTDISIHMKGYRTEFLRDIPTGTKNLKVILGEPSAYTLAGRVVDTKGNPVGDAEVTLAEKSYTTVRTNRNGEFRFAEELKPTTFPPGRMVFVRKQGFGISGKRLDVTDAETFVEITLPPEVRVSGRVLDAAEEPIPGATVVLSNSRDKHTDIYWTKEWREIAPKTQTDAEGNFTLAGMSAESIISLRTSAPGYTREGIYGIKTGTFNGYAMEYKDGGTMILGVSLEADDDIEFKLNRGATLSGLAVYEDSGEPASGVRIAGESKKTHGWSEAQTDRAGRFELKGVNAGPCNVRMLLEDSKASSPPEWTAKAVEIDAIKAGQTINDLKLVLTKGAIVRGKAVDAAGNPLRGIEIRVTSDARPGSREFLNTHTDEDGAWAYRCPPGDVKVHINMKMPQGAWSKSEYTLNLEKGQVIDNIDFRLSQEVPENSPYRKISANKTYVQIEVDGYPDSNAADAQAEIESTKKEAPPAATIESPPSKQRTLPPSRALDLYRHTKIAFVSRRDGNREIYLMNTNGAGQQNLTNNPAEDAGPAWSPDGRKIAFYSKRDGNVEVYAMNIDGSEQTNLTNNPADDGGYCWSPDGAKIAFVRHGSFDRSSSEIFLMNADGTDQRQLTHSPASYQRPSWSPDGKKLAFAADFEIYVINADGSGRKRLTNNDVYDGSLYWSPDGERIAFSSTGADGKSTFCIMNADGAGQKMMTDYFGMDVEPQWSPDGRRIAAVMECIGEGFEVYVTDSDGAARRRLTQNRIDEVALSWAPDTTKIAFSAINARRDAGTDGNMEIYVLDFDGRNQANLTNNPGHDESPAWSPALPAELLKPAVDWENRFDKVYSLDDGQVLRWIRKPFIPERQTYADERMHYHASEEPPPPGYIHFRWDGKLRLWKIGMNECSLASVLSTIGLERFQMDGPDEMRYLKLGGDWIVRDDAPLEDKLSALEKTLRNELDRTIGFVKRSVDRDVIVVTGQYKHQPLEDAPDPKLVYLFPGPAAKTLFKGINDPKLIERLTALPRKPYSSGGGTGSLVKLIVTVGEHFNRPIVFETEGLEDIKVSHVNSSSYSLIAKDPATQEMLLEGVLDNLSKQTSLQFEHDRRPQDVWFIVDSN